MGQCTGSELVGPPDRTDEPAVWVGPVVQLACWREPAEGIVANGRANTARRQKTTRPQISTLFPTATSNKPEHDRLVPDGGNDGAVSMKRFSSTMAGDRAKTDHVSARHMAHLAYIEKLRAIHLHVGDTPDGAWGLYCPRTRRGAAGRWVTLFTVRYDLSEKPFESAKEELAHDGRGFACCSFVRWMSREHPATLDQWDRMVRGLYGRL